MPAPMVPLLPWHVQLVLILSVFKIHAQFARSDTIVLHWVLFQCSVHLEVTRMRQERLSVTVALQALIVLQPILFNQHSVCQELMPP